MGVEKRGDGVSILGWSEEVEVGVVKRGGCVFSGRADGGECGDLGIRVTEEESSL